ncbi:MULTISPECIES: Rid family hydrolase [unclassified Beijerinckia]|uniref:Rid family hydrolase n=1 Tax=unclassified Beijerinckia TaxID=2638183 RepID=UPI000898682E|nr:MULTISPECIES: Rid family hydrolase [unclassified Beijerinckia]MDH7795017.1 2-iminobutanoate/2-iminopropanoate deaminase [Beijerinckia sp. GAS462]SEB84264.1 Enamine deaminase RidA, house cleaning of reactive enamine intermediates, YjgF/YER057c/UK114 family [Beijerinckia sp. 28-YEA-48]
MTKESTVRLPKKWASENWQDAWVPGVKAGNILYISGITASDPDGTPVGVGNFREQAIRCLDKLKDVVERGGGTLDEVVKLTTYMAPGVGPESVNEYFNIRKSYFKEPPASTGFNVNALARPQYLLEIDAIVHLISKRD